MIPASTLIHLRKFAILSPLLMITLLSIASAQVSPEPQREQLLNGLRVLIWHRPGEEDVLIKLRIHSGAAFDLAGKSGEMALLGDILFPDPATREYFTDQMQGRLNVTTDYDSMTVTMQGKAAEFERIVEILRNGLVSTQLTPEIVTSVREGRIKIVKETSISSSILADRAIATRLFGDFPYGQPYSGSTESIARVERADLMLARDRFLNPNNATLVVSGGIQPTRVMRTLRQLLGSWRKSERIVPSTFKQAAPPDLRTLIVNAPADDSVEIRLASRGLARSDRSAATADVLGNVVRSRWEQALPELARSPVFVRHESRQMPGIFVMGATVKSALAARSLSAARDILKKAMDSPATGLELEQAKREALVVFEKALSKPDGMADEWLDLDTYKLKSVSDEKRALESVSAADLQRVARQLFGNGLVASIAVGKADQLKSELERENTVEVLGVVAPEPKPSPTPARKTATSTTP
jgi:zinc protease